MKRNKSPIILLFIFIALLFQTCTSTRQSTGESEFAMVELSNNTAYNIIGVYLSDNGGKQSENLLIKDVVAPRESYNLHVAENNTLVRIDFLVGNVICSMVKKYSFTAGKAYDWKVSESTWPFSRSVDYEYDDSYEYYDDTYGYYEDEYYDTYEYYEDEYYEDEYYDDTYGYYEDEYYYDDTYGYYEDEYY